MTKRFGASSIDQEEAEAEAALEAIRNGTPPGPPAPPAPEKEPEAPAPELEPAPVIQTPKEEEQPQPEELDKDRIIEALQTALGAAKQNERIALGRLTVQASENSTLKEQIKAHEAKIAELAQLTPGKPAAPNANTQSLQDDFGLDAEAAVRFDQLVEDRIKAGVQAAMDKHGIKPGEKKPEPPPAKEKEATSSPNLSKESWDVFYSLVPDFDTKIYNGGKFSPELIAFFGELDPTKGIPYGKVAIAATADDDPVGLAAVYNAFKKSSMAKPGRTERPIAPNTGPKGGKGSQESKPTYARQTVEAYYKNYQNTVGSMTPEARVKADQIMTEYEQAGFEGRIIG